MKKAIIIGIFLVLTLSLPASAEFYRYQDSHGNTIYTDDLSKVPLDQRGDAKSYVESVSKPEVKSEETPSETIVDKNEKDRQLLEQQQNTLTKEFDGLTAERQALDKAQKTAVTKSQIKEYNRKVVEFNARIKAYEEKRDAHTMEVEQYKKRITEKESSASKQ